MQRNVIPSHEQARTRLLEEGARSYLEACTAVLEYQREVQKKCREVMEKYLDDYNAAVKVDSKNSLKSADIKEFVWPKPEQWEGGWATIGVEIRRTRVTPAIRLWYPYCGLSWESGDPTVWCWVGDWIAPRRLAVLVLERFHHLDKSVQRNPQDDPHEIWIQDKLNVEEAAAFDERLEALFERWIDLWKMVGGMRQVFKA
jgi:hypothetical protein